MDDRLFQLKIQLHGSKPPIWRRFIVPSCITLHDLHLVIQSVMGWYDCHLYEFDVGMDSIEGGPDTFKKEVKSKSFRLNEFINEEGSKFFYVYDFGDDWGHVLLLEDNNYINPKIKSDVFCLKGRRACPPEDSGGIYHYSHICKVLNNPDSPEYEEYEDLYGDIDEITFDIEMVNKRLKSWIPWYKEGYIKWKRRMCAS